MKFTNLLILNDLLIGDYMLLVIKGIILFIKFIVIGFRDDFCKRNG